MSTLSDIDIEREVVNGNICIFPFQQSNIKGSSYNLTASQFAYKVPYSDVEKYERVYDPFTNKVTLPPKSTVLMATNEVIWVSKKISGTYHSKVKLVSKGVGHIGTTLDPEYLGISIIAVHNHSNQDILLEAGQDTFASLVFDYLRTKSSAEHDNRPGRPDLIATIGSVSEDNRWLEEDFRSNLILLKRKIESESDFIRLKNAYQNRLNWLRALYPYIACLFIILGGVLLNDQLIQKKATLQPDSWWYNPAIFLTDKFPVAAVGAFIALLLKRQ